MVVRIGLSDSAEVYKFPHTIGAILSMINGRNGPNETSYPNVRDLRCPYNSTTASQGLETQNRKDTKSPQCDDTKLSQKKIWFEHSQKNQGLERGQKPKA